jgi:hypothetical protein
MTSCSTRSKDFSKSSLRITTFPSWICDRCARIEKPKSSSPEWFSFE